MIEQTECGAQLGEQLVRTALKRKVNGARSAWSKLCTIIIIIMEQTSVRFQPIQMIKQVSKSSFACAVNVLGCVYFIDHSRKINVPRRITGRDRVCVCAPSSRRRPQTEFNTVEMRWWWRWWVMPPVFSVEFANCPLLFVVRFSVNCEMCARVYRKTRS